MCLKKEISPETANMPYECYGYVFAKLTSSGMISPGVVGKGLYKIGKEYKSKSSANDPYFDQSYYGFHGYNSFQIFLQYPHDYLSLSYAPGVNRIIMLCHFREPMGIGFQDIRSLIPAFRYKYRTVLKIIKVAKQTGPKNWSGIKTWKWGLPYSNLNQSMS